MRFKKNYMKLILGGIIGNSNYIGTNLNGWIQHLPPKYINPMFLQKNYIDKNDKKDHFFGFSKLKE